MRLSANSLNQNDDLFSGIYASTCSGDNVYDIFDHEDEIITEDSNVWVNTKNNNW